MDESSISQLWHDSRVRELTSLLEVGVQVLPMGKAACIEMLRLVKVVKCLDSQFLIS